MVEIFEMQLWVSAEVPFPGSEAPQRIRISSLLRVMRSLLEKNCGKMHQDDTQTNRKFRKITIIVRKVLVKRYHEKQMERRNN